MENAQDVAMDTVDRWIAEQVSKRGREIATRAAKQFGISRQAVNRRLRRLATAGVLRAIGNTKGRRYELIPIVDHFVLVPVTAEAKEDAVWREEVAPRLRGVPGNIIEICNYGFTEILNNAFEHSGSQAVFTQVIRTVADITLTINDWGIGIFNKIKEECGLDDVHQAVLELSKGKLTTDPEEHSGEGIFFTSRMFDTFAIRASDLCFMHRDGGRDWLLDTEAMRSQGTFISMQIGLNVERTARQIFDKFAVPEDRTFSRTNIIVDLARYKGEQLVSRSQAKRLLARLDKFREIFLDFTGIDTIGQGFADEVFRVFQREHPHVRLRWGNTNRDVDWMIDHVKGGGATTDFLPGLDSGKSKLNGASEDALEMRC